MKVATEAEKMGQTHLFGKYDMFAVVQAQTEAVKKGIQSIEANKLLNASENDLLLAVVEEFRLNVPVIRDEDIHIAHSGETQVDVSGDPMRGFLDPSDPFYIPGNKTVIRDAVLGTPKNIRKQEDGAVRAEEREEDVSRRDSEPVGTCEGAQTKISSYAAVVCQRKPYARLHIMDMARLIARITALPELGLGLFG